MTPKQFKAAREKLGLSQAKLAEKIRVSGSRTIRRWERSEREIPGPVQILIERMVDEL